MYGVTREWNFVEAQASEKDVKTTLGIGIGNGTTTNVFVNKLLFVFRMENLALYKVEGWEVEEGELIAGWI